MEEKKYTLGLTDVGRKNKISNKAIIKMLEDVGGIESEKAGYGLNEIEENHLSWVLLAWKVKVLRRPIYNEEVIARTWARDGNKVFTYRDYEIYDYNGKLCVIATSKWTLVDIRTLKLVGISEEVRSKYTFFNKSVFEEEIEKLKEPKSVIKENDYKILRSQIDVNRHVHNLYYLDIAYEILPEDIYYGEEKDNIEITYKKQIKLNDDIMCKYTIEDGKDIVTIKSKDNKVLHAIVRLY